MGRYPEGSSTIPQYKIAAALGISGAHYSMLIRGVVPIGRETAEKAEALTGRPWNEIIILSPEEFHTVTACATMKKK